MTRKIIRSVFFLLAISLTAHGGSIDTTHYLKQMSTDLKSLKNIGYNYTMEVNFPNGDKDQLKGFAYLNIDDEIYYNDCPAFTMIYTPHWFYKADHQKKTLMIMNLDKEIDKKNRINMQRQVFQNVAINTLLDSVILKTACIKALKNEQGIRKTKLGFPEASIIREIDITYSISENTLTNCSMIVFQPWQKTPKGMQSIEEKITFDKFRKIADKSAYDMNNFFFYKMGKLELKKYAHYKLLQKA